MTQFKGFAGLSEAQLRLLFSHLFKQDSTGLASDGVLDGLGVAQTTTASTGVLVSAGMGVVQDSVLNGVSPLVLDTDLTLDVLVANPMGATPRNDIVVFDAATLASGAGGVRVVVGTPNASPTDPSVPATAVPLARLRHAASATTVPAAKIDDLRVFTSLVQPTGTWTALTIGGAATGGTLKYRLRGNTVDVWIDITSGSFPAGFTQISAAGAVPSVARPSGTPARAVAYVGSGTAMGSVEVTTAGTINVQVQAGTATIAKVAFSYPAG